MNRAAVALLGVAVLMSACGTDDSTSPAAATRPTFPPAISPYEPQINPADFVAEVDNPYFPLTPGTIRIYKGVSGDEAEVDRVTVTHRTKQILGVECTVVKDVVSVDGEIAEKTFDWFAQDRFGNVWYFGEATVEYDAGKTSSAGSWEAGVDGAEPGIVMLGDPAIGRPYRQEYYVGEAEDMGEVIRFGGTVAIPYGSFDDVLVTRDWTPLEPKILEEKYYAPGIGSVLEKSVRGPKEEFRLVDVRQP